MAKTDTSFSKENQPEKRKSRGKSAKSLVLDALKRASKTEDEFWDLMVQRALADNDPIALKELLVRLSPLQKATLPYIEFDFDKNATPSKQASQILQAASDSIIPPDVAQIFVSSIASMMKIEEVTEIADRLTAIEKELGIG